ncbi:ankyrin repeat domain-containing protein [bacterium CPR1]|nr:ankyrin repeat domain-containing protein [bacterium CPR1]
MRGPLGFLFLLIGLLLSAGADPDLVPLGRRMREDPGAVLADLRADASLLRLRDGSQETLLHLAARNGNGQLVEYLVSQGLDLEACSLLGITPLMAACLQQNVETASALLRLGADPVGKSQDSPLHIVAGCGRGLCSPPLGKADEWLELARLLLERGAQVNARSINQWTPLHYAAEANNPGMITLLISRGAEPNAVDSDGNTPLHLAVLRVCPLSVESLLQSGCSREVRSHQGATPLDLARQCQLSGRILQMLSSP